MAMTVNTNMASLNAQRNLSKTQGLLNKSLGRLSSGLRINSAKDDAAGMAISNRFTAQIRGVDQAVRNANDGISMLQTSEGGMQEVTTILQRMREIAVQGSNDTNSASDRASLQGEMDQLFKEIDRISGATQFNGIGLLDGTGGTKSLQIGANSGQTISVSLKSTKTTALNLNGYSKLGELNSGRVGTTTSSGMSINGTAIGVAASNTAAGAASAINAATASTGVTAAAYNTYKGAGGGSGIVTGLVIGTSATAMATIASSGSMTELVDNINKGAPGVTATLNADNSITLSNDTGENIYVAGTTTNTGLNANTYKGYIALTDESNEAISITATMSTDRTAGGTAAGSDFTAANVKEWGLNISTGSTSSTGMAVTTNAMAAGDLFLNGVSVGATTGATAGDKAAAINLVKDASGVSATATTEVKYTVNVTVLSAANATGITINGSAVNFTGATSMTNVVSAINNIGNGISASVETLTGKLVISSASGQNIQMATAGSAAAVTVLTNAFGTAATSLTTGTIALTSDTGASIKIAGSASTALTTTSAMAAGFVEQGGSSEAVGQGLSVESLANANNAINRIDDALDKVAVNRSEVGAVQNRLDSTIANLQNASENFSAANGRTLDADFAKETADMSKQQILMQAGVAMLAQAKQLPQQVLQLLQ
ncbi:MAG: flagellin [Deltaproteobacteria bacterium]